MPIEVSPVTTALVGLALCIPCLILLLVAAGIGGAAFTALGAWFSDNGFVLGAAAAAAVAFATLAGIIWTRRSKAAGCHVGMQEPAQASEGSKT